MHISRTKPIGRIVRFYDTEKLLENIVSRGDTEDLVQAMRVIKPSITITALEDPVYGIHEYYAYVNDDVPDWAIAMPLDFIMDRLGGGVGLVKAVKDGLRRIGVKPEKENVEVATSIVVRWLNYYGAWTSLLLMPGVTDIYISKDGVVVQHNELGLIKVVMGWDEYEYVRGSIRRRVIKLVYNHRDAVDYFLRQVSWRLKTPLTTYNPVISAVDPDFNVRISAEAPPVSDGHASIRVLPRQPWTLPDLISRGMINAYDAAVLWFLAENRVPIMIIGPMGAGKTSLQNAIAFQLVNSVLALIMDVTELFLPYHKVIIPMRERRAYARGIRSISKAALISHALRKGAEIIVVNEARTADEFRALIEATTLGHGTISTFHADDIETAIIRLREKGFDKAEELLRKIAVVVEVALSKDTRYNEATGVYEVRVVRTVRRIHNAEEHLNRLMGIYGREAVEQRISLYTAFLERTAGSGVNPRRLAQLLYIFYRDPAKVLKAEVGYTQGAVDALERLELPPEVVSLSKGLDGLFKDAGGDFDVNSQEGGG